MILIPMSSFVRRAPFAAILLFSLYNSLSHSASGFTEKTPSICSPEGEDRILKTLAVKQEDPVISSALTRLISDLSSKDSVKVWVFFTDKAIFSQKQLQEAKVAIKNSLNSSALKRRLRNNVRVDLLDLSVNQDYINQVLKIGGKLKHRSRWLNAISIKVQVGDIKKIARLPFVKRIKKVASFKQKPLRIESFRRNLYREKSLAGYGRDYGPSLSQLNQINVPVVHDMGFKGENVIVGLLDTGYRKDHQAFASAFSESRVLAEWDFVNNDGNTQNEEGDPPDQHNHGTCTWSALGGEYEGKLYGPAFKASFALAKTEDISVEEQIEEDNWVAGMEWSDSIGAEVISSSLGYSDWYVYSDFDGNTCVTTIAADIAASRGIVVCNAMGNYGPGDGTLIAPADADSILACGAVYPSGEIWGGSSRGPTYDGRTKPEVVAQGVNTYCARASGIDHYGQASGTSLSTPLVAGCVAVLLSAHPHWTVMQIRETLMMTANHSSSPDNSYGWGLIDLFAALNYDPTGALTIQHDLPLFTSDTLNPYDILVSIVPGNGLIEDSLFLFWRSDTLSPFIKQNLQPLGSQQYRGQIPTQSAKTVVQYYFSARDSLNNLVNLPLGAPNCKFKLHIATDFITLDFENGLSLWKMGGINNHWCLTSADSHQGRFSLTDSPQGDYQNNTNSWAEVKNSFDLTHAESPELAFWHRFQLGTGDSGFVEVSVDKGKSWERLPPSFVGIQDEWTQVNLPLDSYIGCANLKFRFRLSCNEAEAKDGWFIDDVQINFKPTLVQEEPVSIPIGFSLGQNFPNPFNSSTLIPFTVNGSRFGVRSPIHTTIKVYNIKGQLVKTLLNEKKHLGKYTVIWDGRNERGREVSSGIYFYQLATEDNKITRKMILLR